jgi:zinc resistance-associated protein
LFRGFDGSLFSARLSAEEDHMLKPFIAATALLAIAGSTFVYAQQGFGGHGFNGGGDGGQRAEFRHRRSPADMAAFTDARIAALKAGLELTPDQAKNWPAFEQAVRDMAQLRIERMQARQAREQQVDRQAAASPFDRLERRADNMSKSSAALKKVADAGAPLYQSLDDSQKGRFMVLARVLRPHHRMHAFLEHGWRQGEGYGRGFGQDNGGPGDGMQNRMGPHRMRDDGDQDSQL